MTWRRWWSADDGTYLTVVVLSLVVARAVDFLWPPARVLGVSLATACAIGGAVIAIVLWAAYRPRERWDRLTSAFFAAVLAAWVLTTALSLKRGDFVDAAVVALPLVIVMLWWRRPSAPAVTRAMDVLGWATVALYLGVLLAQLVGVLDLGAAGTTSEYERERYWLPLSDVLGIDGRWIGPFRTPNVTASAAVFLVVYGASRGRLRSVVFVGTGVLVLLLTGTRSSAFAAIAGIVVLAFLQPGSRMFGVPKRLLGVTAGVVLVAVVAFWIERNPSLTGRLPIWPVYVDLWRTSPLVGVADSGVGLAVEAGRLPGWASHAHSIVIDVLARYGALTLAAVLAVLVIAAVISWGGVRRGRPVGLALVAALLVGGATETLFDWRYLGFQVMVLVGAVLLAASAADPDAPD